LLTLLSVVGVEILLLMKSRIFKLRFLCAPYSRKMDAIIRYTAIIFVVLQDLPQLVFQVWVVSNNPSPDKRDMASFLSLLVTSLMVVYGIGSCFFSCYQENQNKIMAKKQQQREKRKKIVNEKDSSNSNSHNNVGTSVSTDRVVEFPRELWDPSGGRMIHGDSPYVDLINEHNDKFDDYDDDINDAKSIRKNSRGVETVDYSILAAFPEPVLRPNSLTPVSDIQCLDYYGPRVSLEMVSPLVSPKPLVTKASPKLLPELDVSKANTLLPFERMHGSRLSISSTAGDGILGPRVSIVIEDEDPGRPLTAISLEPPPTPPPSMQPPKLPPLSSSHALASASLSPNVGEFRRWADVVADQILSSDDEEDSQKYSEAPDSPDINVEDEIKQIKRSIDVVRGREKAGGSDSHESN